MITLKIHHKPGEWSLRISGPGDFTDERTVDGPDRAKRAAAELVAAAIALVPTEPEPTLSQRGLGDSVALNIRDALRADGRKVADIAEAMYPHLERGAAGRRLRRLYEVGQSEREYLAFDDLEALETHLGIRVADLFMPRESNGQRGGSGRQS